MDAKNQLPYSADIIIRPQEVHVWCTSLDTEARTFEMLKGTLSNDERARGERFKFWHDQRRYISGRGILRLLVGGYLHVDPKEIEFQYNEFGKPYLSFTDFGFNLAHSREFALYAFCLSAEVGVDVEFIRPIEDAAGIAARFFTPAENERFQQTSFDKKPEVFMTIWTLKEAYIKAIGEGLSYPLTKFEVALPDADNPQLLANPHGQDLGSTWTLFSLKPDFDIVAAVAVQGENWHLQPRKFDIHNINSLAA
ncbi:MAG: 4'-phosphopantetheinyl transferase superfamily protein [Candidatus Promineifilaceae bacterium]|nr:4'-phosphopantetheinyl transferase superfamily protein [Candidatus Promineifilaceae bacterium]